MQQRSTFNPTQSNPVQRVEDNITKGEKEGEEKDAQAEVVVQQSMDVFDLTAVDKGNAIMVEADESHPHGDLPLNLRLGL